MINTFGGSSIAERCHWWYVPRLKKYRGWRGRCTIRNDSASWDPLWNRSSQSREDRIGVQPMDIPSSFFFIFARVGHHWPGDNFIVVSHECIVLFYISILISLLTIKPDHVYIPPHTHTHVHTHTHIHTYIQSHTRTHIYIHKYIYIIPIGRIGGMMFTVVGKGHDDTSSSPVCIFT